jgi:hypothetical protein
MPIKSRFLTDPQLIVIGRRYGSDDVAWEASEASARWNRDQAQLASYGYGSAALAAFEAERAQHDSLRVARPQAVAAKKTAVALRDKQVSAGWAWVDRVGSALGTLARADETLATALATATPVDDAALEAGIQAMSNVLSGAKSKLPAEAQADQRLAEAQDLCAALQSVPGTVHTSKGQTVADTVQIDLYDGKLYVWMRDLNQAARRAIRNGNLNARLQEYVFHHLKHSGNPAAPTLQPEPAPQTLPQTATQPT